jgi:hypothetical protein
MVEKHITSPRNVIDLASYRQVVTSGKATSMSARLCRHCGAPLLEGENEDECSSSFNKSPERPRETLRRFRAD